MFIQITFCDARRLEVGSPVVPRLGYGSFTSPYQIV
jgi:hypothetical protein